MMRRFALPLGVIALVLASAIYIGYQTPVSAQNPPFGHGGPFVHCVVTVSTATTLTAVGGSCVAPGAGLSIYITSISSSTNAAGITADSFNTLKYGTGGTCGTGTTVVWGAMTAAATQQTVQQNLGTAIKIPQNNELCWINSTAGTKFWVIDGYIAS
jgi:hypothetical protein